MKVQRPEGGYTLVEVMIFIAISAVLFLSAMLTFRGQQAGTQFSQAVRDFDSKLQTVMNDTSTGFFPREDDIGCQMTGSPNNPIVFNNSGLEQGARINCIFLGKAIQLGPDGNDRKMNIYTAVGRRQTAIGSNQLNADPKTIEEATPTLAFDSNLDLTESYDLRWGMRVKSTGASQPAPGSMAGFYNSLTPIGGGNIITGAQSVEMYLYTLPFGQTRQQAKNAVIDHDVDTSANQWRICLVRGDGRQAAEITVGSNNGRVTSTKVTFDSDC